MSRRAPVVTRREALVLGGLLGAGGLTVVAARRFAPVGPDIGMTEVVKAIYADTQAPVGGNPDGDVRFMVWTDFNCPACRRSHLDMMAAVIADGKVRLVFRDWPIFGADSTAAARLAIAAGWQEPGLYQRIHSRLMRGGRANAGAAEHAIAREGGDVARARAEAQALSLRLDHMLARHANEGFALGLGGTPGHLIGTRLVKGARGQREFTRAIRQARRALVSG